MTSAPVIFVLAGVNGAGKSSVIGLTLREYDWNYFNPDEAAAAIRDELECSIEEANSRAWQDGKNRLEAAIKNGERYTFESTLGGNTIPRLLDACSREVPGDTQRNLDVKTVFSALAYKNCLLPFWVAAYDYHGKPYRFLVNGVTGKCHGNAPWSWV